MRYYTKISLVFFIFLISSSVFGQNNCDCYSVLKTNKLDFQDEKDSIKLFKRIDHLKKSRFKICEYEAVNLQFHFYNNQSKLKKAKSLLLEQESLLNQIDCNDNFLFKLLYNKARYYHAINDLEKLSEFAFKVLEESERLNDPEKQIKAIKELVYLFTRLNEDDKNWTYIKRAEKLILNLSPELYTQYYSWLAFEYENKYTTTERVTLLDSVLIFINEAKLGAFKHQKFDEITKYYRVQEANAYHRGNLKQALIYSDSAIHFGKKIRGYKNLSGLYLSKSWNHLDLNQFNEASKWMDTALFYIKNKSTAASMMLHSEATQIYESSGKLDKALKSHKIYSRLKDSILNSKKLKSINELEIKYNKAKDIQKITSLKKTKQLYLFLIIGSLLAILSVVFYFRQRSLKSKQTILETEQRLNRARINPHFFFNAMASLQGIAQKEKSVKATLYTSRLAKIMRQSLESTYQEMITVEQEIDFLIQYLEIQKLRYPNKFNYEFHIDDDLEINDLKLPGMLMQPFVENAIEHGFKNIDYQGKIDVTFKENKEQLMVIVHDNGKGLNLAQKEKAHKSRAMQIINDRLHLFNKQNATKAFYKIEDIHKKGFRIIVTLPKLY